MARLKRLDVMGWPHLVTQPVIAGDVLVRDAADRQFLWMCMLDASKSAGLDVHAYTILSDHLHVLATPQQPGALSVFMQAIGRRYVAWFNHRHERSGALWAGRFKGVVISPAQYLLDAMVLLETHSGLVLPEQLSVRSGLGWGYSSLGHHTLQRTDPLVQDHAEFWALGNTPFEREHTWRMRLQTGLTDDQRQRFAAAVRLGWPLVSDKERAILARSTDRPLQPRPRGRPRKVDLP